MMYQLPSSSKTMISVPAERRDSPLCLDIVSSDMFESEVIDSKVCRKYDTDFLKGAPPQWLNFYTSVNSPLVERDHFKDLKQLVEEKRGKRRLVTEVSLQHQPGSGGSTLAMQVLWHFQKDLRCARVINSDQIRSDQLKELSKQVVDFFLLSNKEQGQKTVLLLLDIQENTNDDLLIKSILRQNLNKQIHERNITTNTPVVIIFNCSRADLLTIGHSTDDVKLTMKLSTDEKLRFAQKKKQLTTKYKKMSKFHAFNIMQGGFQKKDAEGLITKEMKEYVENHKKSSSTKLLSFLALINSYVPGSHLSKLFCEEFMDRTEQTTGGEKPTLETIMKPFMVIFLEDEQKGQCIRLAHPLIADACLKMLIEHKVARSDIALDFLNSLVKGNERNYGQICERMLITRLETGKNKQRFSRLILDIIEENKTNDCIRLLELASDLFSTDPYYPQTLARLYYIAVKENNKYEEARKWAEEAIKRAPNKSDIKDTLGQVYKKHLQTFSDIKACLDIAKRAIHAFKDAANAAEEQEEENTKFNYRGYYGFLQVCNVIHEISTKNPSEHSELETKFISGLKSDVEMKYDFFEWYLTFSRPNIGKEDPEYIHKDVENCYIHYFKVGTQTDEATLNEKKMRSFGGLLNILKLDIDVLKENLSAIENPQSDNESQTVLYILANVILSQSDEPCANAENLQSRLQNLWESKEQDRSPEFYLLILLLFWPDDAQQATANHPNLENCVHNMSQSYERNYQKYLRGRYLVPLFFFGKGEGLQRLIHTSKLDEMNQELLTEGHEKAEVKCLQRINGKVEDNKVFAVVQGQKIQVTPHNWVSVCKPGQVSFYFGFNIRGPVAYNIRYEDNEVTFELCG